MKKILVVDDELDVTYTIKKMLEDKDYQVQVYNDPTLAALNFREHMYDLVLLDIRMPKMNGFELYQEIRKKDSHVRVCFMTAYQIYRDQFGELPASGIIHFLEKPADLEELEKMIEDI